MRCLDRELNAPWYNIFIVLIAMLTTNASLFHMWEIKYSPNGAREKFDVIIARNARVAERVKMRDEGDENVESWLKGLVEDIASEKQNLMWNKALKAKATFIANECRKMNFQNVSALRRAGVGKSSILMQKLGMTASNLPQPVVDAVRRSLSKNVDELKQEKRARRVEGKQALQDAPVAEHKEDGQITKLENETNRDIESGSGDAAVHAAHDSSNVAMGIIHKGMFFSSAHLSRKGRVARDTTMRDTLNELEFSRLVEDESRYTGDAYACIRTVDAVYAACAPAAHAVHSMHAHSHTNFSFDSRCPR